MKGKTGEMEESDIGECEIPSIFLSQLKYVIGKWEKNSENKGRCVGDWHGSGK